MIPPAMRPLPKMRRRYSRFTVSDGVGSSVISLRRVLCVRPYQRRSRLHACGLAKRKDSRCGPHGVLGCVIERTRTLPVFTAPCIDGDLEVPEQARRILHLIDNCRRWMTPEE